MKKMFILGLLGIGFLNNNGLCMQPVGQETVVQHNPKLFHISDSACYVQNLNESDTITALQGIISSKPPKLRSICLLNCFFNKEGVSKLVEIVQLYASELQLINCTQSKITEEDELLLLLQTCLDIMANDRILKVVALPINCPPQFKPIFREISKEILNWQSCTYKKQCSVLTGADKISALCSKAYGGILQIEKERLSKIDQEIESSKTEQKKLEEINQQKKKELDGLISCIEGKKEELDELERRIKVKREELDKQASSTEQEKTEAEAKAADDQINVYNQCARLSSLGLY